MRSRYKIAAALCAVVILILGTVGVKMLRWNVRAQWNSFVESAEYLPNGERGYYDIAGVKISDDVRLDASTLEALSTLSSEKTLEMLQLHIGAYQTGPMSEHGLEQIRRVLESYRQLDVRLIVRVLYDWEGRGMEADPVSLGVVLTHMEQLGSLFQEYADKIFLIQGVFVGSWAEMHSSRYLTQDNYPVLIKKMHETMPQNAFLAVRTPAYWRAAADTSDPAAAAPSGTQPSLPQRLSLFNDGMLGNAADCGTYGEIPREQSSTLTDKWTREDELAFQNVLNLYVPNGGEVVLDNPLNDLEAADRDLRTMHVSYLNGGHDQAVLEKWKQSVWRQEGSVYDGMSGYEYIERHLGYRYVIRSAKVQRSAWLWETPVLTLEIENVGYASRYTPCKAELLLRNCETGEMVCLTVGTDVRVWAPGEVTVLRVPFTPDNDVPYEVSLRLTSGDGAPIWFANQDISGENGVCRLGTLEKTGGSARG